MVSKLKTWGPVLGSAVLVAAIVLRLFGHGEAAAALESVGSAVGVTGQSSLGVADTTAVLTQLLAAGVAGYGIARKIGSEVRKATRPDEYVTLPKG